MSSDFKINDELKKQKLRSLHHARRCIKIALANLELAILATPTSEIRNDLTESNIKLELNLKSLETLIKTEES